MFSLVVRIKLYFSSDPADTTRYAFIEGYCGDDDELNTYETLTIHQNGGSGILPLSGQFSIDSFKFVASDDAVEMYIHCDITLCDSSVEDCTTCQSSSRRRRSAGSAGEGHGTIGPIKIH